MGSAVAELLRLEFVFHRRRMNPRSALETCSFLLSDLKYCGHMLSVRCGRAIKT
jgi:hypothetical protein